MGVNLDTLLFEHFPALECDHEGKRDRVICTCSMVDLGWQPTVGDARRSWIAHLREVSGESVAS